MKTIYKKIVTIFVFMTIALAVKSQGTSCSTAEPFCTAVGTPFSYNNVTGSVTAQAGPSYGCLSSQPRPSWFYIKTSAAGAMTYSLTQSSVGPGGTPDLDVDFIAWGPYTAAQFSTACTSLLTGSCAATHNCSGNIEDCSFSAASTETMTLNSPSAGQYYLIMITNYNGGAGYITFTQTGGPSSDCTIACPADNFTLVATLDSDGSVQANGATVNCSQPFWIDPPDLTPPGSAYNPFTDQLTPCLKVQIDPLTSQVKTGGSIAVYENGTAYWVANAGSVGSGVTAGSQFGWYLGQVDANFSHPAVFCRSSPLGATTPTVALMSCWNNTLVLAGPQTWGSTACFTLTAPSGTANYGAASFSIAPTTGSVGLVDLDWGKAYVDPALLPAGTTYTVTYTFNNGICGNLHGRYVFTVPTTPTLTAISSKTVCSGSSVSATNFTTTPSGGAVSWTNNNTSIGVASSGTTNIASYTAPNVSVTTTGIFTVVATQAGCSSSPRNFSITIEPKPTPTVTSSNTLCLGSSLTFTGSGASTYSWAGGTGNGLVSTTGSTVSATPTATGNITYTLTATSAAGCTNTAVRTITVNAVPTASIASGGTLTCTTTTLSLVGSGGGTYSWSGSGITAGASSATATVNQPDTYSLVVTSAAGCSSPVRTVSVVQNTLSPAVSTSTSGVLNCTLTSVSASANTTATPVSYNWSGTGITAGGATGTVTVNQPGTFNYTVTNTSNNCKTTGTLSVTQNTIAPIVSTATTGILNCTLTSVNASANTTTTPVAYNWSGSGITAGGTTGTVTVNQPGTFSYSVTNTSNGCRATGTVGVTQNTTTPAVSTSTSGVLNCTLTSVNASANTTVTPVSYNWTGTGITGGSSTGTISVNQPGTFNYTVTNTDNGCKTSGSLAVSQNTAIPSVTMPASQTITCIAPTVTMTASANPSTCTPVWTGGVSGGVNSYTATASSPNVYTLTVTNPANGCVNSGTTQVSPSAGFPSVAASTSNSLSCTVFSAQVVASTTTTPVSYAWSGPGIVSGANTASATVNAPGNYTVVVTNTLSACSSTITTSVTQNTTAPSVLTSVTNSLNCTTTTVNVAASTTATPVNYNWSGTGITAGAGTGTITVNAGGVFNYTVTNTNNNCFTTGTVSVTQNTVAPTPGASNSTTLTCTTTTAVLSGTGGGSYSWSGPGITGGSSTSSPTVNLPGTYVLTVTAANGCTATANTSVTQNTVAPTPGASNSTTLTCTTTTAVLSGTGGGSYSWSGPGITGGSSTSSPTVNLPGTYVLTVTAANGCTATANTSVTQNTVAPTPGASNSTTLTCTTTTAVLSGTGGGSYSWSGPGITGGSSTSSPTVNLPGTYVLTVTAANGCRATANTSVTQNTVAPVVLSSNTGSINCTVSSVDVMATTTVNPASYIWTGPGIVAGAGTGTITVIRGGTFSYTVVDLTNNCVTTGTQAVVQNTITPSVTASNTGSLNCTTTTVNVSASTASSPVIYNWSGPGIVSGATTGTILVNQGGTYDYTVTNTFNNCVTVGSQNITQNTDLPPVIASNTGSLNCTTTSINVAATTTATPVSYNWSGPGITAGAGTGTISVNQGGTYNYTVTNTANSCTTTGSQSITQNTVSPSVTASNTGSLNCTTTSINVAATTTATPVSYNWSGPGITAGVGTGTITVDQGGTYNYTVTNTANSCTTTGLQTITQNTTAPSTAATTSGSVTCTNSVIAFQSNLAGMNYTWTAPSTGSVIAGVNLANASADGPGTYTLNLLNPVNNCTFVTTVAAVINTLAPTSVSAGPDQTLVCSNPNVTLLGSATPSTSTANWIGGVTSPSTFTTTTGAPGVYTLQAINPTTGCSITSTVQVFQSVNSPTVTVSPVTNSITCTNSVVAIGITAVPSNSVSIGWPTGTGISGSTSNTTTATTATLSGVYQVTVTNTSNGCITISSISVPQNTVPVTASITPAASITCSHTLETLSAFPVGSNYTYTWNGATISSGSTSSNPSVLNGGSFDVVVTNTINGCTGTATVVVPEDITTPTVNIAASSYTATCANPTVAISVSSTPTANITYSWTAPSGGSLDAYNVSNPVASGSGVFTVVVTNTINGCSSSLTSNTVEVIPDQGLPVVTMTSNTETITCANPTPTISASSGTTAVSYSWSPTAGIVSGTETTSTPSFSLPGTYSVVVTNTVSGCATNISSNVVTITEDTTVPTMTLSSVSNSGTLTCLTTSISVSPVVTPTANLTYSWTTISGTGIASPDNAANTTFTAQGVYGLIVTNTLTGCTNTLSTTSTFTVDENTTAPTFSLTSPSSVTMTCANPSATLTASSSVDPDADYVWTNGVNTYTGSTVVVTNPGTYSVLVTNTISGCTSSLTVSQNTVDVFQDQGLPNVTLNTNATSITCSNPTPTISASSGTSTVTYSWTPVTGIVAGTETTSTPSFSLPGTYSVVVTNTTSGCSTNISSNVVTVTLDNTVPTVSLTSSANDGTLTCTTTQINLTPVITPSANLTYTWTSSTGTGITTPVDQSDVTFNAAGIYTLAVTNTVTGCTTPADATTTFTVYSDVNTPTVTISAISTNSTIGCGGSSSTVTLNGNVVASNSVSLTWLPSGSVSTPTIDVTVAGDYTLVAIDAVNGCSNTAQYTVSGNTVTPGVAVTPIVSMPCGITTATLSGVSSSTNTITYSWSGPGTIVNGATSNPIVDQPGDYTVTVTDLTNNCVSTETVNVTLTNVTATISADPIEGIAPLPVTFTCTSVGATNFAWSFGDGNTATVQNPSYTYNTGGTYTVVLVASTGTCTSTQTLTIVVEDGLTLEIPNVFTPNNDGVNDIFTIKSTGVKEISLQIFNRWGEKLYEFSGAKASWDGLAPNGILVPEGTYFYFVKATGFDKKEIEKHGSVNLFR